MNRYTDAQKEQIKTMVKEGRSHSEITTFFKATYNQDISSGTISYICSAGAKPAGGKAKRKYTRHSKPQGGAARPYPQAIALRAWLTSFALSWTRTVRTLSSRCAWSW